jgi:CDP-6-deoxy-D-xylo-4-hexulose-3-dehydrase
MQAAVGVEQLKKFPSFIERRKHNWNYLKEELLKASKDVPGKLVLPEAAENSSPSWFGFMLTVNVPGGRNKVTSYLEEHNIQTRLLFSGNIIKHPCFDDIRGTDAYRVSGSLDETERIMNDSFWVGVYPGMSDDMTAYMAENIIKAVQNL